MNLNHLNLTVTDVPAASQFLETYFGLHNHEGERQNKNFTVLRDDNGLVLTLMKTSSQSEVKYPGNFHIGFIQPTEQAVDDINQRLKADGFNVQPPEHHHAYTFYVEAPGGFTIEVLA
jgi:lactoylglutathione lyase